jgi:hypothetical protein
MEDWCRLINHASAAALLREDTCPRRCSAPETFTVNASNCARPCRSWMVSGMTKLEALFCLREGPDPDLQTIVY